MTDISGHVSAGFERVADAFEENFAIRGEVGAEFCAYVGGECVVNLWAGMATPDRPWAEDTLVFLFSVTKGPTALAAQILADRGLLDVNAPVAAYWPGFAAHGKDRALVRHILSHTLGLPSFPRYWDLVSGDDAAGWHRTDEIAARLAAAPLAWEPGTTLGYHSISYGWLVGELVRRIDGRTLGTFFADEVARPLGLDLWIGLPVEQHGRVARLLHDPDPAADLLRAIWSPESPAGAALFIGPERRSSVDLANDPGLWTAEAPAINGMGDARSVARMYAMLAGGEAFSTGCGSCPRSRSSPTRPNRAGASMPCSAACPASPSATAAPSMAACHLGPTTRRSVCKVLEEPLVMPTRSQKWASDMP